MFHVPVEKNGINGHLRQRGKIAELALGYGGSVGALTAMGALEYGVNEDELQPLVDAWRRANTGITRLWREIGGAAIHCVKYHLPAYSRGIRFEYQSGVLFLVLPSGRRLCYVKPQVEINRYGGETVTFEGTGAQKKWERMETYGARFVENAVQGIARDILAESMIRLAHEGYRIVMHVHDEVVIEQEETSLENIISVMSETPAWASGLILKADGYICDFYRKD